ALPVAELDAVLDAYRALTRRKPDWVDGAMVNNVSIELKRAKRTEEADRFYREALAATGDRGDISRALPLVSERGDVEALMALIDKTERAEATKAPGASSMALFAEPMSEVMDRRGG